MPIDCRSGMLGYVPAVPSRTAVEYCSRAVVIARTVSCPEGQSPSSISLARPALQRLPELQASSCILRRRTDQGALQLGGAAAK
jgi:hypothetical protein